VRPLIAIILIVSLAPAVFAESQPTIDQARMHKGQMLTRVGIGLVVAGAIVLPMTATKGEDNTHVWTGLGLFGGGGALLLWGASEKRQASRPQTTIGVSLGRVKGVQIRRAW
jgi:hypothetical protein